VSPDDLIRKPDASITKLIGAITEASSIKSVEAAVADQLRRMMNGDTALPVDMTIVKPHHTLKHVVNDRDSKATFRTCLALPAVYVGQCTCCNHSRIYQLIQNCNRVPVVKNRSSTLLKEVASLIGGKGSVSFMAAEAIADFADDEMNTILALLLDGEGSQSLLVPVMVPRRTQAGKTTWEMQVICGYCRYAIDDPSQAVANAHASKLINDVLYRILGIRRKTWSKVNDILRGHSEDRHDLKDKSDRLLSESKRVAGGKQKLGAGSVSERSHSFSKEDEDALCRELLAGGYANYVVKPSRKSGLHKLSSSGRKMGVAGLDRLLRVTNPEVTDLSIGNLLDSVDSLLHGGEEE
jgi:hypothetical protein